MSIAERETEERGVRLFFLFSILRSSSAAATHGELFLQGEYMYIYIVHTTQVMNENHHGVSFVVSIDFNPVPPPLCLPGLRRLSPSTETSCVDSYARA